MYFCDYHMHSTNSPDGQNTIMEMCEEAVRKCFEEIAITEHFEPVVGDEDFTSYDPGSHMMDILEARLVYKEKLKVKFAVELGQPHMYAKSVAKLIDRYDYDYILGSVHNLPGDVDLAMIQYDRIDIDACCRQYLNEMKKLVLWNQYDCIAHFDLPKRYAARFGYHISFMKYREELVEIFKIIIDNGKGIEINTSGLRQQLGECLPSFEILKLYKSLGGEILTLGSDAHRATDIGSGIRDGMELAGEVGFKYVTTFIGRQPVPVSIF